MIIAPTSGSIGIQPHGSSAACVNKHSATLAVGDVVITSFNHSGAVYPATTAAESILSPFACVKLADGNADASSGNGAHANAGYIGVVIDLTATLGVVGTNVVVQFGGIAKANVNPTTNNAVIGSKLFLSDTAGQLANDAGSTAPDTTVAIALESKTAGSAGLINVLLFNGPIDGTTGA